MQKKTFSPLASYGKGSGISEILWLGVRFLLE
jgi:hypothetical protein